MQQDLIPINHYQLCKLTAERFLKESDVVLYEYNCQITDEMPDVLCFKNGYTTLYEIKTSISDFKADVLKECRSKYKVKYWPYFHRHKSETKKLIWGNPEISEFVQEAPHLGCHRYYVCPYGMINSEDVGKWGLYWVKNNRFYFKKRSAKFVRNIHLEIKLLTHAIRKYASLDDTNILVNIYDNP
jgi:hypothetical protein